MKCDICSERYYRRNLYEGWTIRAQGHRKGWYKEISRICTNCQSAKQTRRIFDLIGVKLEHAKVKV